jgi:small-conductance mechanosensitive channel
LARLALLLFAWAAIVAPFGASAGDIAGRITSANTVFHLGQVSISPGAIFGGVALFFVGLLITRAVRGWLVMRYLPKTRLDIGVRASVAAGVTYLGALVAILFTFAYLGLSFSQIALFASALSVGIGFGLQAIIGNFVSGLILLVERPVKVGDWIAIGDLEGDVKRINIRATEIEMTDRSRLIVPNSDLISKTVRNVTHQASIGRVKIVLKIDDKADPGLVRDLLLARFAAHREVLREPKAAVYLSDVRDGALEFTAFAYVASARQAYRVKSELLFQIVPELKANDITLANSTPVVNIGLPDRLIEPTSSS